MYITIHIYNFEHTRVIMNMKLSSHGFLFHRNINKYNNVNFNFYFIMIFPPILNSYFCEFSK